MRWFGKLTAALGSLLIVVCLTISAQAVTDPFIITISQTSRTFSALNIYYMAATGCNDSNAGTSAGSPWCTPNHSINCGDVILAAAGTYNGDFATWGTVSNCPSTSGGIDNTGGILAAVLLCAASDLGTGGCIINCATGACNAGHLGNAGRNAVKAVMNVNQSYWSIQGWNTTGNAAARGFQVDACLTIATQIHHVSFINDIVYNANQGYDINDCAETSNIPGNGGDYWAVIGSIAAKASQDTICLGAVDAVAPSAFDSVAGTHIYFYGSFAWANNITCGSDSEAFFWDTWDAHAYNQQGVMANNIAWSSARFGFAIFQQNFNAISPTYKIYGNTAYGNNQNIGSDNADGEINTSNLAASTSAALLMINNIAQTTVASNFVYAAIIGSNAVNTVGGSGTQNIFKGLSGACRPNTCDSGDNIGAFNPNTIGTNTYISPAFTNVADLISNRSGAPNCTGFANVTACMGYNAVTQTLTTLSVIGDLQASCVGCSGKGYQLPSTTCAANADYPTWLKGIVYLHWTGNALTQNFDLVSLPCGL